MRRLPEMAGTQVTPDTLPAVKPVTTPTGSGSGSGTGIGSASAPQTASTTSAPSGAHNVWTELVFAFIGTAALAIVANMNERLGRVLLSVMVGFLFMWLLLHSGQIAGWIQKAVPQTRPSA